MASMHHTLEDLPKNRPVLLVDNDAAVVASLANRLRAEGFAVVTAHSGLEALNYLGCSRPAAVLLDLHMPGMDGVDTLQAVRRLAPEIPVILVTGGDHQELPRHRVVCDAAEYIPKPIDWRLLRQMLVSVLGPWPARGA